MRTNRAARCRRGRAPDRGEDRARAPADAPSPAHRVGPTERLQTAVHSLRRFRHRPRSTRRTVPASRRPQVPAADRDLDHPAGDFVRRGDRIRAACRACANRCGSWSRAPLRHRRRRPHPSARFRHRRVGAPEHARAVPVHVRHRRRLAGRARAVSRRLRAERAAAVHCRRGGAAHREQTEDRGVVHWGAAQASLPIGADAPSHRTAATVGTRSCVGLRSSSCPRTTGDERTEAGRLHEHRLADPVRNDPHRRGEARDRLRSHPFAWIHACEPLGVSCARVERSRPEPDVRRRASWPTYLGPKLDSSRDRWGPSSEPGAMAILQAIHRLLSRQDAS